MSSSNSSKENPKLGNTKQVSPARKWCFTLNNYTIEDILDIEKVGSSNIYVFGEETAPTTGTKHLQGYIEFKKKCRPKNLFINQNIHWEIAKGTREQNYIYCTKENKFKTNIEPPETIEYDEPYGWQLNVVEEIKKKPDPRKIYWYWENIGGKGKSSLARYLCIKHGAIILSGKVTDMKYGIVQYHMKHKKYPKIIIIDIPRSIDVDYLSYTGIEEIKNGTFFCPKYESDMVIMNRPHIIIFSNDEPSTEKMSADRWVITNIK